MQRDVNINEISDGRKYSISDMVKIGCNDCNGCQKCCENMSGLITLDPYDVHRIVSGTSEGFESLLNKNIELIVDRGVLIPTLKMNESTGKCTFLGDNGRCSIHNYRSGICRLFPMGRVYEDGSYYYFLQKDECPYPNKTKVKLKNWLDTPDISKYEKYISDWHYFISSIQGYIKDASDEEIRQINSALIQMFYITKYDDNFYESFYLRLAKVKALLPIS